MAVAPINAAQILVGGYELNQWATEINMGPATRQIKDATTFASGGWFVPALGLRTVTLDIGTLADFSAGGVSTLFPPSAIDGSVQVVTAVPAAGVAGDPAIFTRGAISSLAPLAGKVGELSTQRLSIASAVGMVGGVVLAPEAARTTTGSGSILAMTGPVSGQSLYASLHVIGVSGTASPTVTVTVQSAATVGFASPTTRLTFSAATAIGAQWATPLAGPVTDGFWRASWTISGTSPSIMFLVAVGVAAS